MNTRSTKRYCADPEALAAMKHDGMGWGHDLDCGCFHAPRGKASHSRLARVIASFTRRV